MITQYILVYIWAIVHHLCLFCQTGLQIPSTKFKDISRSRITSWFSTSMILKVVEVISTLWKLVHKPIITACFSLRCYKCNLIYTIHTVHITVICHEYTIYFSQLGKASRKYPSEFVQAFDNQYGTTKLPNAQTNIIKRIISLLHGR